MDQNSTNGTDKRSWRERLGIGAGKEMPRISEEFSPAVAARPTVRPAPMAPRAAVKPAPMAPRSATATISAPPPPEKLAEKLKAQRDAQERLAEQRVLAAKQRAEIKPSENGTNGSKPKFTFAVEETAAERAPSTGAPSRTLPVPPVPKPQVQASVQASTQGQPRGSAQQPAAPLPGARPQQTVRPVAPPPAITTPPLTPPRPPLGADRSGMGVRPAHVPPIMPQRPQQRYSPPPQSYVPSAGYGAQVPPYRPMEPSSRGYSTQPTYVPPVGGYNNQPRLNVPPARGLDYDAGANEGRARHLRPPARPTANYRDDYADSDIFGEPRTPRRATAGEYSQAYRDVEQGYDEELPPSRGPWLPLLLLLLLMLSAGGAAWWLYQSSAGKTSTAGGGSTSAPLVAAPELPAKVVADPASSDQPAGQPTKKLIYDRIVGDREVLGAEVTGSEEVPAQPEDSNNVQSLDGISDPSQPVGQEDLVPLPLPPPPGDGGTGDQQGAAPSDKTSNEASITPAAGESQAAVPSLTAANKTDADSAPAIADAPPVPGEQVPVPATASAAVVAPVPGASSGAGLGAGAAPGSETIGDIDEAVAQDVSAAASDSATAADTAPAKKLAAAGKPKKPVADSVEPSLGAEPVVLVPPADGSNTLIEEQVASIAVGSSTGGGLYGGEGVVETPAQVTAEAAPPIKKKRTLADLFKSDNADTAPSTAAPPAQPQTAQVQKINAVQPTQQVASAGGYVAQLASFPNKNDATTEYGRLKAKHAAALSGSSPIVTQATVGGSLRYRLAVGTFASREQASAVCAKLFAAGERDCLVRRQ